MTTAGMLATLLYQVTAGSQILQDSIAYAASAR